MKIFWTEFASTMLSEIYTYHKEVASAKIAQKIKHEVFKTTKQLEKHPNSGQVEEALRKLNEGHRYLVKGNYKIIYKPIKEGILVTDIFDARQDPLKINDSSRKR